MQTLPRFRLPKLVLIQPIEHKWVSNILTVAHENHNFKQMVLNWRPGTYPKFKQEFPLINSDGHTGGTLCWSVSLAQAIILNDCIIEKHDLGYGYDLSIS